MSQRTATHRGFTLAELAVVILVVAVTLGVALPTLARMRDESGIQESMCRCPTSRASPPPTSSTRGTGTAAR
ncbi:MAG: prepilin-type N-terminal cleavage/methylation domain-containing protein [Planctomycetota bacterium]